MIEADPVVFALEAAEGAINAADPQTTDAEGIITTVRPLGAAIDPALADLIERARHMTHRTPEQAQAARRAYVLAEMAIGDDAEELAWRAAFRSDDQATIDLLNAEGEARRQRADKIGKREGWW